MSIHVRVQQLDHVVLHVSDPEKALEWYVGKLGLKPLRVEEYRAGKAPFPSVEVCPGVILDLDARGQRTGENVAHYCLVIDEVDLGALVESGEFEVVGGPFRRWGALGEADLVYISDPDGNVIELRHYGPSQLS